MQNDLNHIKCFQILINKDMALHCSKRSLTLTWGILECVFFSGILNGWIWLTRILKEDYFFVENCNITIFPHASVNTVSPSVSAVNSTFIHYDVHGLRWICMYKRIGTTTTTAKSLITIQPPQQVYTGNVTDTICLEQDDRLELLVSLIFIIRNILMLPFGIFLDKYGTSRTRIVAISFLACGSLMMLFSNNNFPWLALPALTLLSVSGLLILLTDIQIANLFGARRYTVMSILVGSYYSGGFILFLMKVTRQNGVSLQTSFMFLAVGIVPVLISTIALLPRSRIPWPLPLNYGTNKYSSSTKDESSRDWQRRISAGGKKLKEPRIIISVLKSSMYLWLLVWFTLLSLKAFIFDMNLDLSLKTITDNTQQVRDYMNAYGIVLFFSLFLSPIIGIVMDWKKSFVTDPKTDQMMNIVHALVIVFILSILSGIAGLLPHLGFQLISYILMMMEKVAALSTLCAMLTHVHFPSECFGRCMGLAFCASGLVMSLQFTVKEIIHTTFDDNVFFVNLIVLILVIFGAGHPINVWYHCKRDRIQDTTTSEPKKAVTIKLMSVENDPEETETVIESVPCDSKANTVLHVTDL